MDIDFFTNDRFRVLTCMQQRQIDISGSQCVPLSQRQIAEITGIAYKTVNSVMKTLRDNGYIIRQGTTRGQYSLTSKAINVLSTMPNEGVQK
jgi:biotin operon repressor